MDKVSLQQIMWLFRAKRWLFLLFSSFWFLVISHSTILVQLQRHHKKNFANYTCSLYRLGTTATSIFLFIRKDGRGLDLLRNNAWHFLSYILTGDYRQTLSALSVFFFTGTARRKIRLIAGNAKCSHLENFTLKGTLRQLFICLRPRTSYPPPLHTVYVFTVYLFTEGKGESWTREEQQFHKAASKIPTWLTVSPV